MDWDFVNAVHAAEIPLVLAVQASTPDWLQAGLELYTEWIHPVTALTVAAPVFFGLGRRTLAVNFILVVSTSDIANTLLKWVFAGNRPYWSSQDVRQFAMTCEAGYGMPSGHVQAFTTATYFLIMRLCVSRTILVAHCAVIVLAAYSRVYTGAHFPSQTLAAWGVGATFGLGGHRLISSPLVAGCFSADQSRLKRFIAVKCLGALCATVAIGTFCMLGHLGRNPLESLAHAHAGCRSSRGVIGLVFESAAGVLGALAGVAAVVAVGPCTDSREPINFRQLSAAVGCALTLRLALNAAAKAAAAVLSDGPDRPRSVGLAFAVSFLRVALAAPLGWLAPAAAAALLGRSASAAEKRR